MTHEEAIKAAAHWYRVYYEIEGDIRVLSVKEDDHYYCELYSENVVDSLGTAVYDDGQVESLGEGGGIEGMEGIERTTFKDPEPVESRWNGQTR